MKRGFLKKLLPMILCFTLLFGLNVVYADDNQSFDNIYIGDGERGMTVDNCITTLFRLSDQSNNINNAYCVDRSTSIRDNAAYSRVNVSDADYYTQESANHIRAIIQNAYPFISISEVINRSGIRGISTTEAITATQLAIWHYSNESDVVSENTNVDALFNWYINLAPATVSNVPIGNVNINAVTSKSGDSYTCVVRYSTNARNVNGSGVELSLNTSKDISTEYPMISRVDNGVVDGENQVTFTNIPADATLDFTASGIQNVDFDGYFYSPEGGRKASQSLVGAYIGNTAISASASFTPSSDDDNAIKIIKIDSATGEPLAGAVFEISDNENFTGTVYTVTTDSNGIAIQGGLTAGRWFVRETKAPQGYISYEKPFSVSVGNGTTVAECKNTAYGSIQILKSDENGNPVNGAHFSIYKGEAVSDNALLYSDLISDEAGVIIQKDIEPGVYTIVETEAPHGYHLNSTPVTVTVKPGETAKVSVTDETIKKGIINIFKKDAVSGEQLSGAEIEVFKDEALTQSVGRFITSKDNPVSTDKLEPGTYYVKEISAPDGYLNDDTDVKIVNVPEGGSVDVTFFNNQVPKTAGNFALVLFAGIGMLSGCAVLTFAFRKHLIRR